MTFFSAEIDNKKDFNKCKEFKSGMVVHTCNPAFERLRQEDLQFKNSLYYTANNF